uniref:glutamine-rich protein 2 n=1 Tax=Callospermophilus lateralis TaxID=76772 RepID=UPI004038745C
MPPAIPATKVSLRELADLAIGTPEVGAVNFTVLHTLILAILKNLGILETLIDLQTLSPEAGRSLESLRGSFSTQFPPGAKEKRRGMSRSFSLALENQVQDLTKQLKTMDGRVEDITTHLQFITSKVSAQQLAIPEWLEEMDMPTLDTAQIRSGKVLKDTVGSSTPKVMRVLQDVVEDVKNLKEAYKMEVLHRIEDLEKQIKDRDEVLEQINWKLGSVPGAEEATMVTWEELEQAITDGWKGSQMGLGQMGLPKRRGQSALTLSDRAPSLASVKHPSSDQVRDSTGGLDQSSESSGYPSEDAALRERSRGPSTTRFLARARDEAGMSKPRQATSQLKAEPERRRGRETLTRPRRDERDVHPGPSQQDLPSARVRHYAYPDQRRGARVSQDEAYARPDQQIMGLPGTVLPYASSYPHGVVPLRESQLGEPPPEIYYQGLEPLGMDQHGVVPPLVPGRDQQRLELPGIDQVDMVYRYGMILPGTDQLSMEQAGIHERDMGLLGMDQQGLIPAAMGQQQLVLPGIDQQGLLLPLTDQYDLISPGLMQVGRDQQGLLQPTLEAPGFIQPGTEQYDFIQPGRDQPGLVQPGRVHPGFVQTDSGQRGLVQPRADQGGLVTPGTDQQGLVQLGIDLQGLVQPGVDQHGLISPDTVQHDLVQPGMSQRGGTVVVPPGVDQPGLVSPSMYQRGMVPPGVYQRGMVPPGMDQRGMVPPGVDQRGLVPPGVDQHAAAQPGVDQHGFLPPGVDQRGFVSPGVDQRALMPLGMDQRGLVPRGVDQHGLVPHGVDQHGLVPPGIDQHAVAPPGVDQRGLVPPGVDQRGLVPPGVDQRGMVPTGVDQRAVAPPGVDQRGLVPPGVDQRGLVPPGMDKRGLVPTGVDQRAVVPPGVDQRGLVPPGVDQRGLVPPGVDQPPPVVDQHGLVPPGMGQRGLVQPGVVQPGLVQPDAYLPGVFQPGAYPGSLAQAGAYPGGLAQAGAYPHGVVQPGMDQRGLRQPSADWQGLMASGTEPRGFPTFQRDPQGLTSFRPYPPGVGPSGRKPRGQVSSLLPSRGLASPIIDQRGLVPPETYQQSLMHPGLEQRGQAPDQQLSVSSGPDQPEQVYPSALQQDRAYSVSASGGPDYEGIGPHDQDYLDLRRTSDLQQPGRPAQAASVQEVPSFVSQEDSERSEVQSERHDSLEKLAPNFPIAVETFRLMGEMIGLYVELKERIKDLDEKKAGQTDLEKIEYLLALMVQKTIPPDLQEQLKSIKTLAKEVRQERAQLNKLQRILEGDSDQEAGKELKASQLSLQLGIIRVTVADIEKELSELRESQERGKAAMENSVSEASLYLQDQLDKLRTIIESMLASSSTLLSMSMTPHKPLTYFTPGRIDPNATCPACSLDLGHQVSTLVQRYEQLQDIVSNLAASRPSKKAKLQSQDEELLGHVQSAILQVLGDCEKLNITTSNLIEDHQQKQKDIDMLYQGLEKLEKEKANREHLEMEIHVKADKSALAAKVSRVQFDATTEQLTHMMQELVAKMTGQEQDWQKMLDKLLVQMDSKLDRLELDPVKQLLEDRWRSLRKQLKERPPLYQADEAAAMRRQLLAHFHCLSCDRPLETAVTGQMIPLIPMSPGLPAHRSIRPYTIFELEQVRQQSRNLKLGSTFCRGDLSPMERSAGRLRTMHSKMLMDIEKVQIHFGGSVKASSQMIHELLQAQGLTSPCYKRVPDAMVGYTYSTVPRRCGGSHTLTYPYRRSRQQHLSQGLYAPEEIQIAMKHDEVDILGLDGHIYKGRMDTRLPGILNKDTSGVSKHKTKQPRPHLPRHQALGNIGQLPSRPQSTHLLAGNSGISSRQHLSQSDMAHPPSPTEMEHLQDNGSGPEMHMDIPPEEELEEPTRGPRSTTAP